ncbi:MAG: magnesium transporter [Neisseriaceae bacterium]|nr:magnesium transporter [Neisseriaceae bacterium]MBP6861789.1 magnesium transporter [Neisseriaceae bacterium]
MPETVPTDYQNAHPRRVADALIALGEQDAKVAAILAVLNDDKIAETLKFLAPLKQQSVLQLLAPERATAILEIMPIDEVTDLALILNQPRQSQFLASLSVDKANQVKTFLGYSEDLVGSITTTEFIALSQTASVGEALAQTRMHAATAETVNSLYVVDENRLLVGVVSIRRLLSHPDDALIGVIMDTDVGAIGVKDRIEAAHRMIERNDWTSLPVIDETGRMLGLVTVDDIMEYSTLETTKDTMRMSGSLPIVTPYFETSIWGLYKKRIFWILLLFVAEAYTGTVLKHYEGSLETVVALAFFIPLLVGTGGNTGTQVVATVIRSIGTGEIKFSDTFRVMSREFMVGLLIGVTVLVACLIRAYFLGVGKEVGMVVGITALFVVVWASVVASCLPIILTRLKLDPAVISSPMITTVVDGTGLIIYFSVAHALISALQ